MMITSKRTTIEITPSIGDNNKITIAYCEDLTSDPQFNLYASYAHEASSVNMNVQCAKDIIKTLTSFVRAHEPEYQIPVIKSDKTDEREIDL